MPLAFYDNLVIYFNYFAFENDKLSPQFSII